MVGPPMRMGGGALDFLHATRVDRLNCVLSVNVESRGLPPAGGGVELGREAI